MSRSPILWFVLGAILVGAALVGWRLPSPPDAAPKPVAEPASAPAATAAPEPEQVSACVQYNWQNGAWVCTQTALVPADALPSD